MIHEPTRPLSRSSLLEKNTRFIEQHAHDDVRALALQATRFPDIDMPFCLQQIAGRQQAADKLPSWVNNGQVIFPPRVNIEQCSSEKTARYKAALLMRLAQNKLPQVTGTTFIDATGGFGVDFIYMAKALQNAEENAQHTPNNHKCQLHYADTDKQLCQLAQHNFPFLGIPEAYIHHEDGVTIVRDVAAMAHQQGQRVFVMVDPSRRDAQGQRTYAINDCEPDMCQWHDELMATVDMCIVKLSPMVDWHEAVRQLPATREVHIVSTNNECKELLLVLQHTPADTSLPSQVTTLTPIPSQGRDRNEVSPVTVHCINDEQTFTFEWTPQQPATEYYDFQSLNLSSSPNTLYLYEPNASIMKAGCFTQVAEHYNILPVSSDSHLYLSERKIPRFIGRSFIVQALSPMKKNALRQALKGIVCANVAVRNFPMTATQLQKNLGLKDGGDVYLFGTTTSQGQHIILCCKKM